MRKLLLALILLSPLLAGLAFPVVGDTVIYDNVRYIITAEACDTSDGDVRLDLLPERRYIKIPATVPHESKNYRISSLNTFSIFPSSLDYDNPARIIKVDFSEAVHIYEMPRFIMGCIDIDTLMLPPNLTEYFGPLYAENPDGQYNEMFYKRPLGIKRIFSTGERMRKVRFTNCMSLVEIDISSSSVDSLAYISIGAHGGTFEMCYWLERVRLPATLRYFGQSAFSACLHLTDINMPDSLVAIEKYCFNCAFHLDTLRIPATVSHIDSDFITSNVHFKYIEVDTANQWFTSIDGTLYTKSVRTAYKIPYTLHNGDTFTFPDDVDTIGRCIYSNIFGVHYTGIYEIPNAIHDFVFNSGLRYIGRFAFYNSSIRSALNFGHTHVTSIPENCFSSSELRGIELPAELSSIEDNAFDNCEHLDSVRFLGGAVRQIGRKAFSRCTSLRQLNLSAQTHLKTISPELCWRDSALRSVRLPKNIDSIGCSAFADCVSLSEIEVPVLDPITIDESVFSGVDKSSCRLIVPAPSIGKYRAAPVWRDFLNIESGDLLTLTVLSADTLMGSVVGSGVYRLGEEAFVATNPSRGYRFTRWSDGSTEQYRRVALTSDSTLTAYFEFDPEFQYRVSVRTFDRAMGSVSPATAYARYGETVTITATPLSGYRFALWSDSVTANPRDITVTRDTVLTAHFAPYTPDTFAVTLLCDSAMGTVSGSGRYPEGTAATLTATPREGYAFTRWEDNHGLTFTDNPLTLTVTCDTLLTALFREDGTGHSPATADNCAAWVTPDGTLRVRCPGCRLMELRTVTGLTLYSGAPADIPLPHPGVYLLTLDGDTYKVMRR